MIINWVVLWLKLNSVSSTLIYFHNNGTIKETREGKKGNALRIKLRIQLINTERGIIQTRTTQA